MVVVSYSGKEINAKLVYYGAGLSGKTTNLESIYEAVPETSRGKMVSMKTQSDRTLFFDLLPLDLGEIMGFKTRFLLYTVPGQVFYNATRKLVLKGADAIVFVADSEVGKMDENKESLANLRTNLTEYGVNLDETPWVLQYNKRDLPNVYTLEQLNAALNPTGRTPWFEAVATQGKGVFETFRGISHLLMEKVTRELRRVPLAGNPRPSRSEEEPAQALKPNVLSPSQSQSMPAPGLSHVREREAREASAGFGRELELPPSLEPARGLDGGASPTEGGRLAAQAAPVRALDNTSVGGETPHGLRRPVIEQASRTIDLNRSEPPRADFNRSEPPRAAAPSAEEVVVPVTIPRGGSRQIVIKIVVTDAE